MTPPAENPTTAMYVLLRAFVGGALHQQHCELGDGDLLTAVMRDLRELLRIQGEPTMVRIHRWPKAMAQYVLGHGERLQEASDDHVRRQPQAERQAEDQ